ncbi:Flagellar assembly factor FliW [Pelotomaculum schinkii]|uniref:Flagellar assembly factor FliW n=1 Tax=Pelotomaculum schinkii TaxID=78350 RepID=A0A4Y7R7I1_9FIRM|nr:MULTISPECIES: flagellar assembly protein FliW [Pelotomaculum]TEB04915.1 Flagellar assembly factor FliW [Pelotomaculum schinkii]TEB15539.1 Flagellar assembly factor FliW [Pelotomaculum sp. FP]
MADADRVNNRQYENLLFPWGLPGLEDYHEFTLNSLGQDSPFGFLQAAGQQEIGLLLVNPYVFFEHYEFELSEEIAGQLKIDDENQVAVLCTVNTSQGYGAATVNLLAPIIINREKLLAKQVVLNDQKYSLRTPLNCGAKKEERKDAGAGA